MAKKSKRTLQKDLVSKDIPRVLLVYKYIIFAAFCILVLMSPYYRGLYFDYELGAFQAAMSAVFILFVIYLYLAKEEISINRKIEIILLLFMVAYIIPFFFAANRRLAIGEFFKYAFYFAIFFTAIRIAKKEFEKLFLLNTLFISTIGVAFFGYQAAVKLIPETARPLGMAMNGLWVGNMISSTLQYHNTAGTVLAFGFIIGILLGLFNQNRYLSSLYFALSSFILTAFFFTYSRGCYGTLPVALFVFFLLLPRQKRISLVVRVFVVGVVVVAFLTKIGSLFNENGKVMLWGYLLLQIFVVFVAIILLEILERKLLFGLSNRFYIGVAICVIVLGIIGFITVLNMHLIPSDMVHKMKSILTFWKERNFVERMVFYRDGLKIFLRSPIFGFGGGTWVSLYFMYQSYLYFTTQSHNYFLQVLLDTGIFGFGILMVFLYLLFSTAFRAWKKKDTRKNILIAGLVSAALQLYLHSILDFDFSLASVQVLLFVCIGIMISTSEEVLKEHKEEKNLSFKANISYMPLVLSVFYVFALVIALNFRLGNYYSNLGQQALQSENLTAAYSFLSKAVVYDSLNSTTLSDYATTLYKIGDQNKDTNLITKANSYFKQAIENDRFSAKVRFKYAVYLLAHGEIDEGLKQIEEGIKLQPLQPANYELKADAYKKVGDFYYQRGEKDKAMKYYEVVLRIPDEMERVKKERERIPKVLKGKEGINEFVVTQKIKDIIGQININ